MVFVQRENGKIIGVFANAQKGYAEEQLKDDASEITAFKTAQERLFFPIITDRQFFQQLAMVGAVTPDEALAAVKTGAIPAALQAFIDTMPEDQKFSAEMLVSGAVSFNRNHPMTLALAAGMGWSSQQVDDLWRSAAQL